MPFSGSGTGIQNADDIFFSNISDGDTLQYNSGTAKWTNGTGGGGGTVETLPAGVTLTVAKSGTWPARPTDRADIIVQWKGADPSPSIVSSGTGGMLDGVDIRLVTP